MRGKGLRYRVSCEIAFRVTAALRLGKDTIGKAAARRLKAGQTRTVVVRLAAGSRNRLLNANAERLKATLVTIVRAADGMRTIRRRVVLKR